MQEINESGAPVILGQANTDALIRAEGCVLLDSSLGIGQALILTDADVEALAAVLNAQGGIVPNTTNTGVVITGTPFDLRDIYHPSLRTSAAVDPTFVYPEPVIGVFVTIKGSDLQRVVGQNFTITLTFASLAVTTPEPITATFQLIKEQPHGTNIIMLTATKRAGYPRLAQVFLDPGVTPIPPYTSGWSGTILTTGVPSDMTTSVRILHKYEPLMPLLLPRLAKKAFRPLGAA